MDMKTIVGQEAAKRALEIALSGNHSILLIGPTSCGKSMLLTATREIDSRYHSYDDLDLDLHESFERFLRQFLDDGNPVIACTAQANKIPASLLDRFPLIVTLSQTAAADMLRPLAGETSATIKARVETARETERNTTVDANGSRLLREGAEAMQLSARALNHAIAVAHTIAATDKKPTGRLHVAEALCYKRS